MNPSMRPVEPEKTLTQSGETKDQAPEPSGYDSRYVAGIDHFNAGEFFESHEVIEDYWREVKGEERDFLRGVIHAAVALLHFERGNLGSAISQYGLCVKRLTPYRPKYMGLGLVKFQSEMEAVFAEVLREGPDSGVKLDRSKIPKIQLEQRK